MQRLKLLAFAAIACGFVAAPRWLESEPADCPVVVTVSFCASSPQDARVRAEAAHRLLGAYPGGCAECPGTNGQHTCDFWFCSAAYTCEYCPVSYPC